jgi:hypothetical protein
MARWLIGIAVAVAAAGCGPKHKNQCAGTTPQGCVAGEVCSFDHSRGCRVCQCRPFDQGPMGNDPDDLQPAVPVH